MLNRVAQGLRTANRTVVKHHPNSMECQVLRRSTTRTAGAGGTLGGQPTLGGLGVMDPEDETEVDYEVLGDAYILFTGRFEPASLSDRRDAPESVVGEATIEPVECDAFEPKDGDLVMVMPGGGVVVSYEVTKVLSTVNIPPYVPKYELSPQGDMLHLPEVAASQAERP